MESSHVITQHKVPEKLGIFSQPAVQPQTSCFCSVYLCFPSYFLYTLSSSITRVGQLGQPGNCTSGMLLPP